jgi:hypothetical protein
MFQYPLTFNNHQEHINHVITNSQFYSDIVLRNLTPNKRQKTDNDEQLRKLMKEMETKDRNIRQMSELLSKTTAQLSDIQEQNSKRQVELEQTKERLNDMTELEDLLQKKSGVSVVHKGSCDEKYVEMVLKEVVGDEYEVDNSNGIQKMDIRLIKNDGSVVIGVECKDKDKITEADITKFRRDKVLNRFHRSIFVSTGPIRDIVQDDNSVVCNEDEMFIVTKDPVFLGAVIKTYLSQLDSCESEQPNTLFLDATMDTYNTWQTAKKSLIKLDKSFLCMLRLNPNFQENLISKHIYMTTKTFLTSKFSKY